MLSTLTWVHRSILLQCLVHLEWHLESQAPVTLAVQFSFAQVGVSFHGCVRAACTALLLTGRCSSDFHTCKVSVGIDVFVAGMIGTRLPAAFLVLFKGGFTWREQTFMAFSWIPKVCTPTQLRFRSSKLLWTPASLCCCRNLQIATTQSVKVTSPFVFHWHW